MLKGVVAIPLMHQAVIPANASPNRVSLDPQKNPPPWRRADQHPIFFGSGVVVHRELVENRALRLVITWFIAFALQRICLIGPQFSPRFVDSPKKATVVVAIAVWST